MCFKPKYRILKEARVVSESADHENFVAKHFYIPQEKTLFKWRPMKECYFYRFEPDLDLMYMDNDFDRKDCVFETIETAMKYIECSTYEEEYRGYSINKGLLYTWPDKTKAKVVFYYYLKGAFQFYNDFYFFETHDEVIEEINQKTPITVRRDVIHCK